MYTVSIWGQFGDGGKIADGQAVRTTIITRELKIRYGEDNVGVVNTNGWRKHPLSFLWQSFMLVAKSRKVAIAPADNGYKIFVPLLIFFNIFFRRELIHIVIGGFLPNLLRNNPIYIKLENKFSAIFVQTDNLLKDLANLGVQNLYISSNPKRLNKRDKQDIAIIHHNDLKVCTLSRINESKGIEVAINAVKKVNERLVSGSLKLDLYGLIQPGYEGWFKNLLEINKDFVSYKGIIDFDRTVETLKDYFLMLLPTFYYGEGFPGNVVDAYNSGLPIVATNWLYNKDVISDGRNGILVPIKDCEALANAIERLFNDRVLHYNMALNCLVDAEQYHPDKVLKSLYEIIDK